MPIRNNLNSALERMSGSTQTYGRASTVKKQSTARELPTDLIFCDEYTGDVYQLSYNGASQFLKKMGYDACGQNVEWLVENLINIPVNTGSFTVSDAYGTKDVELSVSCSCSYDPGDRSLARMGIAKSMVCKAPVMPPAQYQRMQKQDGANYQHMTEAQMYMRKVGIPVGDGEGVLFGRDVLELSNALRKGTAGDGSYVGHDDTGDVGGMLGQCNVAGSHRLTKMKGWQE